MIKTQPLTGWVFFFLCRVMRESSLSNVSMWAQRLVCADSEVTGFKKTDGKIPRLSALLCPQVSSSHNDQWSSELMLVYTSIFSLFATDLCEPCRRLRCCESPAGQQVDKHSDLQPTTMFTTYRVTSILFLSRSDDRFELWGHRLHHVHVPKWVAAAWLADWLSTCLCILPEKCLLIFPELLLDRPDSCRLPAEAPFMCISGSSLFRVHLVLVDLSVFIF